MLRDSSSRKSTDVGTLSCQAKWMPTNWQAVWSKSGYPTSSARNVDATDRVGSRLPIRESRARGGEIRCGITKTVLENFVTRTFYIFRSLDQHQRQDYLRGAFHFTRYVHETEQIIGMQISRPHLDYWSDSIPYVFGQITTLRRLLDSFSAAMASIPDFKTVKGVLLVEGWSEKVLLERLRATRLSWFTDLLVETYEGRGNRGPSHLQLLIKHFKDSGYQVYISGDADGGASIFQALIRQDLIAEHCTHSFSYDLETGVPPRLLYLGLRELGLLNDVTEESFCNRLQRIDGSVILILKSDFGVDLQPHKLEVARAMGAVMASDKWDLVDRR